MVIKTRREKNVSGESARAKPGGIFKKFVKPSVAC